ncbi:hypothetical protein E4631_04520 [Hymenobacter sp. UV11]|uniref:hypothetical protein n=1 Tax=Hymenobacter sp. UV11 TaxID=1849735 RepID=UPI001061DFA9|nr:hypothetical protein [Hymenobacter sp. UV11]TFZ68259.1 hypothetical protein E4631_04520 [Hymenobacter sp. UV11]
MQISHRAPAVASAPASLVAEPLVALLSPTLFAADKAPRLSCCCRLSELLPLVRQLHDAARAAQQAAEQPGVAA